MHGGDVEAFGDQAAIARDLELTAAERGDQIPPLVLGRLAVEVRRPITTGAESFGDFLAVGNVDTERDRRRAGTEPRVFVDRGADDNAVAHGGAERVEREVAHAAAHARQIRRPFRSEAGRWRQIALGSQLGDRWSEHHGVEDRAEAFAVQPLRGCGDAEHLGVGRGVEDSAPHARGGVVGFVDDNQVDAVEVIEPPHQGGDGGNLNRRGGILFMARGDELVVDAEGGERAADLVNDFLTVAEDDDAVVARCGAGDDMGEQDGLSRAGRRLIADPAGASEEAPAQRGKVVLLIRAKHRDRHGRDPSPCVPWTSPPGPILLQPGEDRSNPGHTETESGMNFPLSSPTQVQPGHCWRANSST